MIRVLTQVTRLKLITSPWCTVLLMYPMGSQTVRKFSAFYGKRRFGIPCLQQSATLPYPEPDGIHFTLRRPFLDDPLPYHTSIMSTSSKLPEFCSFPRQSPNNICISFRTYQRRMRLPTKIILLIISCLLTPTISFRGKSRFVLRTEEHYRSIGHQTMKPCISTNILIDYSWLYVQF